MLPDERAVETQDGARWTTTRSCSRSARGRVEAVPGALTFRGPQDAARVAAIVRRLREGTIRRVAFVVPAGTAWALPLYELALQTAARRARRTPRAPT